MNGPVQRYDNRGGRSEDGRDHRVGGPSVWRVGGNVAATAASRLPSAVLGAVFGIELGVILGPIGMLLAAGWLLAGLATGTRLGERALAHVVLRYRPADGSWLEAEVRRLAPGRRVSVYVAPKASGVFALGGHTIGLGELSVGSGAPTPALLQATADAVLELRSGKTRPELPLLWLSLPWWFARELAVRMLPRRLMPLLRLCFVASMVAGAVNGVQVGRPYVAVLVALMLADMAIRAGRGRRQRRPTRRQLQPAAAAVPAAAPVPFGLAPAAVPGGSGGSGFGDWRGR